MDRHRMVQLTGHGPGFMLGKHMTGHESIQHYNWSILQFVD
jgi:hypothetical protein